MPPPWKSRFDVEATATSGEPDTVDEMLRSLARAPHRDPPVDALTKRHWGAAGRYVVERRLGRGGMGTVYVAQDTVLGRLVALKVLDERDADGSSTLRTRLLREARLAARVEHERVARIYDVGEHAGQAFVAMEYVRGVTLRAWMAERRTTAEIAAVLKQIAEGLGALHSSGIVHRDLKPENAMLASTGGIKLLDFGLAMDLAPFVVDGNAFAADAAVDGVGSTFAGTPAYMAPETCAGQKPDARADVFAMGVIAYELIAGERPFRGTTIVALFQAIRNDRPAFEGPAWKQVSPPLREAVERMLERDPASRYSDGSAALEALRKLESASPTLPAPAYPASPGPVDERSSRRPRDHSELATLTSKVERFWLDSVLARSELAGLLPQRRTLDFSLVAADWERRYREMHDAREAVLEVDGSLIDLFEDVGRLLLIVGDPGCGKTLNLLVIARYLLRSAAERGGPVPVVLTLSTWRKGARLDAWLCEELGSIYQVPPDAARDWTQSNKLSFLLDGLDEVPVDLRSECVEAINEFLTAARPAALVVTSRVDACLTTPARPLLNAAVELHTFTDQQVDSFIATRDDVTRERLRRAIGANERVIEMMRTPLLLNLLVRVYEGDHAVTSSWGWEDAVSTQICRLYVREVGLRGRGMNASRLSTIERHLRWMARLMDHENRAIFRVEDLQPWSLRSPVARTAYFVATRLLAAMAFGAATILAIGESPLQNGGFTTSIAFATRLALVGGAVSGAMYAILALLTSSSARRTAPAGTASVLRVVGRTAFAIGCGALIAAALGPHSPTAVTIMCVEFALLESAALGFGRPTDGRDVRTHQRRRWRMAIAMRRAPVVAAVVLGTTIMGLIVESSVAGEVLGLVVLAGSVVLAGLTDVAPRDDHVNSGIHATLATAARAAFLAAAFCTIVFGSVYGLVYGVEVGIALGALAGLRFGGVDALYHYVLRAALFVESHTSLRLARELDSASDAGLLRKVGGGYLFMHRLLLEHYSHGAGEAA
jgi:serine/threonine protein kinase